MSQFILGIGNTLFYSLGLSYIDDNTHQHKSPLLLSYVYAMRIFGPTIGYGFAYVLLKIYIAPTLTPIFANDDPRWIGNSKLLTKIIYIINILFLRCLVVGMASYWDYNACFCLFNWSFSKENTKRKVIRRTEIRYRKIR